MVAPVTPVRILIVDNNAGIRQSLQLLLEGRGYAVETASTVREGLERVAQSLMASCFRVVIMDATLPDGSGVELLKTIKRLTPDTTCLVIAAQPQEHPAGSSDVKPLPIAQFLEFIQRGLPLG